MAGSTTEQDARGCEYWIGSADLMHRNLDRRPVLVTNARYPGAAAHRADPDPCRPEDVIDDLDELRNLVKAR
jgi:hypothetical protein